nr:hypothetical protein [Eubacterium sp.]
GGDQMPEKSGEKKLNKLFVALVILASLLVYGLVAWGLVSLLRASGTYPAGEETLGFIYKGDRLYEEILRGNYYPLYDPYWYNGVDFFRTWSPLPIYVLALLQYLFPGKNMDAYLAYNVFVFGLGACNFLFIGLKKKRPVLGAVLGIIWFFLPANLVDLYQEGDLAKALVSALLPLLIYHIYEYISGEEEERKHLFCLGLVGGIMVLCHLAYMGILSIFLLIFLLLYCLWNRRESQGIVLRSLKVLVGLVAAFLLAGIWLVPALTGGILDSVTGESLSDYFQSGFLSLNAWQRTVSDGQGFYFGLAAFILGVFGIFFARKKEVPGFVTGIFFYLMTTNLGYVLVGILPGGDYLWLLAFLPVGLIMIFMSLLYWESLRKWILFMMVLFLVGDCIPSYPLIFGYGDKSTPVERLTTASDNSLITYAKSITNQRMALLDGYKLGAKGIYLATDNLGDQGKMTSQGIGWRLAETSSNVAQLNQALEEGCFEYLFDRCLDLGNDTVLIDSLRIEEEYRDLTALDKAADRLNYQLMKTSGNYRVYHQTNANAGQTFGLVTSYDAIGIGDGAGAIALYFPDIEETQSNNLNDYNFDDLKNYQTIFLDGFIYDDRQQAEELLTKLADYGCRIVILSDGVPEDPEKKQHEFLGVRMNSVTFKNGYPELVLTDSQGNNNLLNTDLFARDHAQWNTFYMTGLDQVDGYTTEDGVELPFYGRKYNNNIIFLGINLTYHYALTRDKSVEPLLAEIFSSEAGRLPNRILVPIKVTVGNRTITILSDFDNVNTSLAYHDHFMTEQGEGSLISKNFLTHVNKGSTIVVIQYPNFWFGLSVSVLGLIILFLLSFYGRQNSYFPIDIVGE